MSDEAAAAIAQALREQADSDEAAGTLYSHVLQRRAADEIERLHSTLITPLELAPLQRLASAGEMGDVDPHQACCEIAQVLGYLAARTAQRIKSTAAQSAPLTVQQVVSAIRAVDDEAARRGKMFPQTSDEQREDRHAVRRVIDMLEWFEKNTGCARLNGWPRTEG